MHIAEPYTIFQRTLKSGKKIYYYQFRDEQGRRSNPKSCGTDKKAEAKRICQYLYNHDGFSTSSNVLFKTFSNNFFSKDNDFYKWKTVNLQTITDTTLTSYVKLLNFQILPYFKDIQLNQINTDLIKQWIIWASEKWSAKTTNNAQSVLNIILKSALEKGLIKTLPTSGLSFRKTQKKDRNLLTPKEIKAIYNGKWTNSSARKAFLTASITGMRIGEVIALRPCDIGKNFINVRHSYSSRFGLGTTKTKICRYVPSPEGLLWDKSHEWIFQGNKDKPITAHCVYMNFCKICDELKIDRIGRGLTIHTLRNSFISFMQSENIPLQKIKATVGHADECMTDHYTYWKPEMLKEVYQAQKLLFDTITEF